MTRELDSSLKQKGRQAQSGRVPATKPFTQSQFFDHTAKALYVATKLRCTHSKDHVAMAFPDHGSIRKDIVAVKSALAELRIGVLWVTLDGVRWDRP